jgi:hypothetical protein
MFHTAAVDNLVLHPNRFPMHNSPEKGQILGGTCNTYGCDCDGAQHWCALTFAFYCEACADEINQGPSPSCEEVDQKPDLQDMHTRYRHAYKAYRACPPSHTPN